MCMGTRGTRSSNMTLYFDVIFGGTKPEFVGVSIPRGHGGARKYLAI